MEERIVQSLRLFAQWGHAVTVEQLAESLLAGRVRPGELARHLRKMKEVCTHDGVVCLRERRDLIPKTVRRRRSHASIAAPYLSVALEFSSDLVRWCPFVECVALAGSLATGGFDDGDDIDFDLFVRKGTKYLCYLMATIVGLKYAWRHRHRDVDELHRTPFLPKIICINVVWTEEDTRPFVRQDVGLAFELLRCVPLYGAARFRAVLEENPWIARYFPQLYERQWKDAVSPGPNPVGHLLASMGRWPRFLALLEAASRGLSWLLYSFVQWSRRRNPEAVAHMEFMRRVKWPYEVFQD
jgi:hypothetical protein